MPKLMLKKRNVPQTPFTVLPSPTDAENGQNERPNCDKGKTAKKAQTAGLRAARNTPSKRKSYKSRKTSKHHPRRYKPKVPLVPPTPGPMDFIRDCMDMSPGDLRRAYPREYRSWAGRKHYATTEAGWDWASAWNKFRAFLIDIGKWPDYDQKYELDRLDPRVRKYGPGLCKWSTREEQANNKTNNVKIVVHLTGEVYTVKEVAALTKVSAKTVYSRVDLGWHTLELLAGRRIPAIKTFLGKLDQLPVATPTHSTEAAAFTLGAGSKKASRQKLKRDLADMWNALVAEHRDAQAPLTHREEALLLQAADALGDDHRSVMKAVLEKWGSFTEYVAKVAGLYSVPTEPLVKFLLNHARPAMNYYNLRYLPLREAAGQRRPAHEIRRRSYLDKPAVVAGEANTASPPLDEEGIAFLDVYPFEMSHEEMDSLVAEHRLEMGECWTTKDLETKRVFLATHLASDPGRVRHISRKGKPADWRPPNDAIARASRRPLAA